MQTTFCWPYVYTHTRRHLSLSPHKRVWKLTFVLHQNGAESCGLSIWSIRIHASGKTLCGEYVIHKMMEPTVQERNRWAHPQDHSVLCQPYSTAESASPSRTHSWSKRNLLLRSSTAPWGAGATAGLNFLSIYGRGTALGGSKTGVLHRSQVQWPFQPPNPEVVYT